MKIGFAMENRTKIARLLCGISFLGTTLLQAGCQSSDLKPTAAYVKPAKYSDMDCGKIELEAVELSKRAHRLLGIEPEVPIQPGTLDEVTVAIPWPEIEIPKEKVRDGNNVEGLWLNLSDVRGEMRSLKQVARTKHCPFILVRPDRFKKIDV